MTKLIGDSGLREPDGATDASYPTVDYRWFDERFTDLRRRLTALEASLSTLGESVSQTTAEAPPVVEREYYSVPEFAELVKRREYTVREWCRLARINAEKCDTGRGDAKNWKIPAAELPRFLDHGLLPESYLR